MRKRTRGLSSASHTVYLPTVSRHLGGTAAEPTLGGARMGRQRARSRTPRRAPPRTIGAAKASGTRGSADETRPGIGSTRPGAPGPGRAWRRRGASGGAAGWRRGGCGSSRHRPELARPPLAQLTPLTGLPWVTKVSPGLPKTAVSMARSQPALPSASIWSASSMTKYRSPSRLHPQASSPIPTPSPTPLPHRK